MSGLADRASGLVANTRPGSLEVTGQQRELFPFDAFKYRNEASLPSAERATSIYPDDSGSSVDLQDPFELNVRGRNSRVGVRSIRVSEILGPEVEDQAVPAASAGSSASFFENDEVWDAGNAEGFELDEVAGDERESYDAPVGAIAIKAPVLLTGGLYIDDGETKLKITSKFFKLGSINDAGTTGTGFVYDLASDVFKFSGQLVAASGSFTGSLNVGDGTFVVDSDGNVTANSIDIAGGALTGTIALSGTLGIVGSGIGISSSEIRTRALVSQGGGVSTSDFLRLTYVPGTAPLATAGFEIGRTTISGLSVITTYQLVATGGYLSMPNLATSGSFSGQIYVDSSGYLRRTP